VRIPQSGGWRVPTIVAAERTEAAMCLAPSSLAQYLGAGATLGAVLVALFKDELLRRIRRPILTVRIKPEAPDCLLVSTAVVYNQTGILWTGRIYWLRLWIENVGKGRAEQVQVFVSSLFKENVNGEYASVADFEPMNLRWANSRDPNNPEIFASGISGGFGKHCDLCSVSDPANPTDHQGYPGQCVGTLQLEVVPGGDRNRLPPGKYVLEIDVGSANAAPVTIYVQLNIEGQWSPDRETMFRDHLGVQLVARPHTVAS
jgi:hypothetical protein